MGHYPDKFNQTTYNGHMETTSSQTFDLAIIGTGPAGYTASIYASRYNLSNIIIGAMMGGQASESHKVCNYPGLPDISGVELANKFNTQAQNLGATIVFETVSKISGAKENFTIETQTAKTYTARAIILATGAHKRRLNAIGEQPLIGHGVNYCTTCDGPLYKGKTVAVIGGSDAANTSAIYLADIAKKVYQIYRKDQLRGEPAWVDQVLKTPKIEVIYNTNVTEILGKDHLEGIKLDAPYNGSPTIALDGLFIEIGAEPDPILPKQLGLATDPQGYVVVTPDQKTSVPGIWAAGDLTTNSSGFHQIITAAAEGAVAAQDAYKLLKEG